MIKNNNVLTEQVQELLLKSRRDIAAHAGALTLLPGGSDRKFYRLGETETVILMVTPTSDDAEEYIQVQQHLVHCGVAVPEVFVADAQARMVLMEDIGTESLYEIVSKAEDDEGVEELYEAVLHTLIELQLAGSEGIEVCVPVSRRMFDHGALRWESEYFRKEFLEGLCGCPHKETEKLEEDFEKLAHLLSAEPRYFMHRDFQSTNIFRKEGRIRIIDFQSAHRGMLSYDLAALLRDPYVVLSHHMRKVLFHRYYALLREQKDIYETEEAFRRVYLLSAIQRNMQALGAFSFLSRKKGKAWFIKAIPSGLDLLKEGLKEAGSFRDILGIVQSARITECVQSTNS